jgi:hypothetical protein
MRHVICALVLVGACTNAEPECGPLEAGAYRFELHEQSGSCGSGEAIVTVEPGAARLAECEGTRTVTDACSQRLDLRCPTRNTVTGEVIGAARYVGVITERITSASGTLAVTSVDAAGNFDCSSVYEAVWTAL